MRIRVILWEISENFCVCVAIATPPPKSSPPLAPSSAPTLSAKGSGMWQGCRPGRRAKARRRWNRRCADPTCAPRGRSCGSSAPAPKPLLLFAHRARKRDPVVVALRIIRVSLVGVGADPAFGGDSSLASPQASRCAEALAANCPSTPPGPPHGVGEGYGG